MDLILLRASAGALAALALWPLAPAAQAADQGPAAQPAPATPAPQEASLESLLALARERAAKARVEAAARLRILIAALGLPFEENSNQIRRTIQEILDSGDLSTAPLVEALHEPEGSPKGSNAARALAESKAGNVVEELEATLQKQPMPWFRARAAWVLGRQPGAKSARLALKLLDDSESNVAQQAALSLGKLKSHDAVPALLAKLPTAPPTVGRSLLSALAQIGDLKDPKVTSAAIAFLETPTSGEALGAVAEVLEALRKTEPARAKELLVPGLKAIQRPGAPAEASEAFLKASRQVLNSADREAIAILKKILADAPDFPVKSAAAFALDTGKDPSGAAFLLKPVNEAIKENPENTVLLRQRGQIHLELHRYRDGLRDYDEVKRISAARKLTLNDPEYWIEYARCQAALKTLQAAADALRQAVNLGAKAKDFREFEEFTDLRKQPKFTSLFESESAEK